jgi:hypothetical protein
MNFKTLYTQDEEEEEEEEQPNGITGVLHNAYKKLFKR